MAAGWSQRIENWINRTFPEDHQQVVATLYLVVGVYGFLKFKKPHKPLPPVATISASTAPVLAAGQHRWGFETPTLANFDDWAKKPENMEAWTKWVTTPGNVEKWLDTLKEGK